mgnify:CR=1 FL=1|tara:strand:- start:224 stop:682 length:459 start_codon:yes stop_codon:yes gene_type:complete
MPIKSFRGKLADDAIETISLHTNTGSIGYRIKKFQVMPADPTADNMEATVKIYKIPQTAASNTIDFGDNTMLAAAYIENHDGTSAGFSNFTNAVIFDNEVFNQDLYVTLAAGAGAGTSGVNYYFELEQVKLDLNENTVATLKDIRNIKSPDY